MEPSHNFTPGQQVGGGRFELRLELGQGSFGIVWLAVERTTLQEVALKFLRPEICAQPVLLERIRAQTKLIQRLARPEVVQIYEFLESPEIPPCWVMEFVAGGNLAQKLAANPQHTLDWQELSPIVFKLCKALDDAHQNGLLHGNLKPGNILFTSDGKLKLADFGLPVIFHPQMLEPGNPIRDHPDLAYLSPQQVTGQLPSSADDVYGTGAVLYTAMTGRPPFAGAELRRAILEKPVTPIEQRWWELNIENSIPPEVTSLICSCLAKKPEERPSDLRTLGSWLNFTAGQHLPQHTVTKTEVPHKAAQQDHTWLLQVLVIIVSFVLVAYWSDGRKKQPQQPHELAVFISDDGVERWVGDAAYWTVEDGVLVGSAENTLHQGKYRQMLIWRGDSAQDFDLSFDYKIKGPLQAVLFYRADFKQKDQPGGYVVELTGARTGNLSETGPNQPRRELALRGQSNRTYIDGERELMEFKDAFGDANALGKLLRKDDWNHVLIRARGKQLTHLINGKEFAEIRDENPQRFRAKGGIVLLVLSDDGKGEIRIQDFKLQKQP